MSIESPVHRMGIVNLVDLKVQTFLAKTGAEPAMGWIIDHSRKEGQDAPIPYFKALKVVLEQSETKPCSSRMFDINHRALKAIASIKIVLHDHHKVPQANEAASIVINHRPALCRSQHREV